MRPNRTLEIGTGLFVLLGFAALLFLTTQLPASGVRLGGVKTGFRVTANFDNIGDLKVGSPVTMSGVRVGEVSSIHLDSRQYQAVVGMRINPQFNQIPDDSYASIETEGLLGGKFISLSPGGDNTFLKDGSHIDQTQSAIVLETLINKLFASFASKGSGDNAGNSQSQDQGSNSGGAGTNSQGGKPNNQSKPNSKDKSESSK
jgi:phospholipid/cholesterol/gamma-HCH transport system substrate-binding protein